MDKQTMPVVLIPSLEPDGRLPAYVAELMAAGFDRVVVVNDGSGPEYQPIYDEIEALGVHVLGYPVNKGKGGALKTGLRWILEHMPDCAGVVTADSDGQHKTADCLRLAEAMASGGEDALWMGCRDFNLPNIPPKSRFGNKVTSVVFKALYGVWLPDTQTGLRGFSAKEIPFMAEVEGERYEYEMNVLIACARRKLPVKTITIETVYENNNEGTHFHPLRDSWRIYKVILGNFFNFMASSLVCFGVDQGLAALLREWLLPLLGLAQGSFWNVNISGWGARLVSSVVNFTLNKNLVFRRKGKAGSAAWKYAVLCVVIICLSNLGVWALGKIGVPLCLAKLICDGLLYFVSYRVQQNWVFAEAPAKEEAK